MQQAAIAVVGVIALVTLGGCTTLSTAIRGEPRFDVAILLPPDATAQVQNLYPPGLFTQSQTRMQVPYVCQYAYNLPVPPEAVAAAATAAAAGTRAVPVQPQFDLKTARNQCVAELLAMIDVQYNEFKRSLLNTANSGNLFADTLTLGLGEAGALVPGKTTKAILAQITAGVAGVKTAIDSDVLMNSAVLVIINQMDTDRATAHCTILSQLKNDPQPSQPPAPAAKVTLTAKTTVTVPTSPQSAPITATQPVTATVAPPQTYSMYDASTDLVSYYEAGTFTHAMQSLQAKTGSQATSAKQQVTDQKTGSATTTLTSSDKCGAPSTANSPS